MLSLTVPIFGQGALAEDGAKYVGSRSCEPCHEEQYANFTAHSGKADSYRSVTLMKKGLTDAEYRECLECHTTGYGKPGGFVSEAETPDLKDAGCEACHGPGSLHAETEEPDDIDGAPGLSVCRSCHNPERVEAFNFKPLIIGGAH